MRGNALVISSGLVTINKVASELVMIQLDLSPELESQVLTVAYARGLDPIAYAKQVLSDAVSADFYTSPKNLTVEEFRACMDRLAELGKDAPPLSEYALTRESFYEDHD